MARDQSDACRSPCFRMLNRYASSLVCSNAFRYSHSLSSLATQLFRLHSCSKPSRKTPALTRSIPFTFPHHALLYDEADCGPRAPLGTPVLKPFFCLRATVLSVLMRPVPVVFLRLAFSPQLSVPVLATLCPTSSSGPFRIAQYSVAGGGGRTLPNASARVSAVGASLLLNVERAAACCTRIRTTIFSCLVVHSDSAYRSVCTGRGSCCGACRSWTFPSLYRY